MGKSPLRYFVAFLWLVAALAAPPREGAHAQEALQPGEAFVTRFSGTASEGGSVVIDTDGTVGSIIDLRRPGAAHQGAHWSEEPQRSAVTAAQVGQVFGVALDDANPPNVYLTATSAFGLHRNADNTDWMAGMWGPEAGPGTVWRLNAANNYQPEIFAGITLNDRPNSGAALGNIAYDRWNKQFYVSDLETGMIQRLRASDGTDLGHYDHGVTGRANFLDATTGETKALDPVAFDPATSAHIADCPSGDFARTASCWNFADFRRRVWGLGVRRDSESGEVRLFYSVWGSQGFGNADYAAAGEDQKNSVWSVRIAPDGAFDQTSVRREFFLPDFFRSPEAIARAGLSHPVTDIAFPALSNQPVMVLAERGGVRNLGLTAENAFATPHEARVLRYQLNDEGVWEPVGRYDVGFYDRKDEGPPYIRADSSGGAVFGLGYTGSWEIDPARPDAFLWVTGDALCSRKGPCLDPDANAHTDVSEVHGLMGREESTYEEIVPAQAFQPYPAPGPAYPASGPDRSFMIDIGTDDEDPAPNDATRIGDIEIYQQAVEIAQPEEEEGEEEEPEPEKPDLKLGKRALSERCTADGECTFEVVIENVGELPYDGPLVIHDVADGGATLISHALPDWSCNELFAGIYECSHPALTLAPGENVSVALTFKVPDWWSRPVYSNCAELTAPGFAADDKSYNNELCDYVPTVDPPEPGETPEPGEPPYGPDLMVQKFGYDAQCDWSGNCYYVVRVTNVGPADYSGPLHLHDRVHQAGSTLADWTPQPDWTCEPVGAIEFDCTHPPVTLTPGDFRDVTVVIHAPPIHAGYTHIRNCAWFDWNGAERDYSHGNEYDCASIGRFPPGHPGALPYLEIYKQAYATCYGRWKCNYFITITNSGSAPYFDEIEIHDTVGPPQAPLVFSPLAPWNCQDNGGGNVTCNHPPIPGGLPPGESVSMGLGFLLPDNTVVPGKLWNCGKILWDGDGDGVPEDHESCALALVCDEGSNCPNDLAVKKYPPQDPCDLDELCVFTIQVRNLSNGPFDDTLVFTDIPDAGLGPPTIEPAADWACDPAGANYLCKSLAPVHIPAGIGGLVTLTLSFPVPPDYPLPNVKNCARLEIGPPADTIGINNEHCTTAYVPFPDLAPFGGTECRRGESCDVEIGIDNKGKLPFLGSAGLRGTLSPAVKIASIASAMAGFNCGATGNGAYECKGEHLNIEPGGALAVELSIDIPADFQTDKITHVKEMFWPDREVKDKNPGNDRHESIITIVGPAVPICTGGTVKDGRCVCPEGTKLEKTGTNAYRCVPKRS